MKTAALVAAVLILSGCGQSQPEQTPRQRAPAPTQQGSPAALPNESYKASLPDERAPLPDPKSVIDPKSAEAASQVVQHYGALIEQGRWTESWKLWGDPGAAMAFDRNWRDDSDVHMESGKPGDMEGAAGSSYVTVPAVFFGKSNGGASFRLPADVKVRRVNDVPGSTQAQRRWHIERIDLRA